jgi:tRNA(Ile)-lysidine synthase
MLDQFSAFIRKEGLCLPGDRILVAVSGGPDSVLLAFLLKTAGFSIGLAHCNYQLRGAESDADEELARKTAAAWGLPFFRKAFDTCRIAEERGLSIQEAARDLRYEWLEDLRQQEGYDLIATGHHLDDAIETMLFNLIKGCGIHGLHGILPKRGRLIRPLLFAEKAQILEYLEAADIAYREDHTNQETYYDRNKIRHQIIPQMEALNPRFRQGMRETLLRMRDTEKLFDHAVDTWRSRTVEVYRDGLRINWAELMKSPAPPTLLYEILSPFGFRSNQLRSLFESPGLQPGRQLLSQGHRLLSDREYLLLEPLPQQGEAAYMEIGAGAEEVAVPGGILRLKKLDQKPATFPASPQEALLDAASVQFPVVLRRWKAGDYFHPLGMKGKRKKLQDFFTDLKVPLFEKEKIWILEISGQIAWVVGYRIDENFKMREDSAESWHFRFEQD